MMFVMGYNYNDDFSRKTAASVLPIPKVRAMNTVVQGASRVLYVVWCVDGRGSASQREVLN